MKKIRFKKGAAMVEFAVIATVLIPLTLYTSFFTELLHFRNKVDEANYFAAWELTSYNLSDYRSGSDNMDFTTYSAKNQSDSAMTSAIADIKARTIARYIHLDSADQTNKNASFIMLTEGTMTLIGNRVTLNTLYGTLSPNASGVSSEINSVMGFLTHTLAVISTRLNKIINEAAAGLFLFNTKNVAVKFKTKMFYNVSNRTVAANSNFRENRGMFAESSMFSSGIMSGGGFYESPEFTVVADTWALNDGRDVLPTPEFDKTDGNSERIKRGYRSQVQRMYFMGLPNMVSGNLPAIAKVLDIIGKVASNVGIDVCRGSLTGSFGGFDPLCAKVASINYSENYLSDNFIDVHANPIDNIGNFNKNVDKGQYLFETAPMIYARNGSNFGEDDGEMPHYIKTLAKRKNNYMGHPKEACHYTGSLQAGNVKCP